MIRLLPRPGLLTGVVVVMSITSGIAVGATAMAAALAARMVTRRHGAWSMILLYLPLLALVHFSSGAALGGMAVLSAQSTGGHATGRPG